MNQLARSNRHINMPCPNCNAPVQRTQTSDGDIQLACPRCGWGQNRTIKPANEDQPHTKPNLIFYLLGLILSPIIVIGPYIAALIYLPQLFPNDTLPVWIHITYWLVIAIYLAAAYTEDPHFSTDLSDWAWDNPFSFEDDVNRASSYIALLLLPGKLVVWTLASTFSLIFKH
ncbi:hypothetical protein [Poriferisphaera sp. WC338]|uniref:hypothetical protein n=1 Tax=Poriferisphaera sp. WC338 TaxID=3425129 RepID=UPI003D815BD5